MKTKLDLSMFTQREIDFIKSDVNGIINRQNPHYSRAKLYYYDIEKGEDIIILIECSSPFIPYHLMLSQNQMLLRGFVLPYKTEWQRIIDPDEIQVIKERENQYEL